MSDESPSAGTAAPDDEARRALALRLAVDLRHTENRDQVVTAYVTKTARAFEAYLRDGTVER